MDKILNDPWLVGVGSQVIGGVISGLIVHYLTQRSGGLSVREIEGLFHGRVKVPKKTPLSLLVNWRYLIFYLILFTGILGLTLLQDPTSINLFQIIIYVVLVTWWSMVALNVFILMDGAVLQENLPNPLLLFIAIIFPIIGHTKSVTYTLFDFIIKFVVGLVIYGVLYRYYSINIRFIMSVLLTGFAIVDGFFYGYLFLTRYPEFYNWRDGRFIFELGWPKRM